MKKLTSLSVILILVVSLFFCGCTKDSSDYIINNGDVINIGVIVQSSVNDDAVQDVYSGITYAAGLANSLLLDKTYEIKLVVDYAGSDFTVTASDFASRNVATVICEGRDKTTTDSIISAFEEYNIPLIFTDNYSDSITKADNAFSISIPYSYQSSAIVSHLAGEGMSKGTVICADDSDYSKSFAKVFENTFTSQTSGTITTYYFSGEGKNFNAKTIASAGYEFAFIIGNINDSSAIYSELISAEVNSSVFLSEVTNISALETSEFNSVSFISKFESDDNNYIGTDFINTFAEANSISTSDVTPAVAYGYDAYMTVYDALKSLNSNGSSIFETAEATESDSADDSAIYVSEITTALKNIKHMGVTDVITFSNNGTALPTFVYINRIDNSHAGMINRYNYTNE